MVTMSQPTKSVVVLIALPEEMDVFREVFPYKNDVSRGRCVCFEHESGIPDIRVISILAEQMGAQSAGNSADIALREFNPDLVVVLGIAGGVSSDLAIGDVCVSNEVLDVLHNNKVSEKGGVQEISFAPDFYNVDAELVSSFTFLRVHPTLQGRYTAWRADAAAAERDAGLDRGDMHPKMEIGPIACGPVSASIQFNQKLKSLHRKVVAIETESGGVFQRVASANVPAVAIRGVSDLADSDKGSLEKRTNGSARRLAMLNASNLLQVQLYNPRFVGVANRHMQSKNEGQSEFLLPFGQRVNIVAELEREIKERLKELSPDFRARPEGFYLPIPRARRISYDDELTGRALESPENIVDCLRIHDRTIVRLPRAFPSQALGWSLANSLIRQQIDGKVVLPFVVSGSSIRPPKTGLQQVVSEILKLNASDPDYLNVFIIEEPCFESRTRIRFLTEEIKASSAKIMILTKSEDNVATMDSFIRDNALVEYELAAISFSETAFFLERAFDMTAREAEAVAIRLDDTFRKFRLDAHPTYFAGLQEETLAALINANKRAELIQLAVDGLLTLIVAADRSKPNLSRTTRERFLRRLVLEMAVGAVPVNDEHLSLLAGRFLEEYAFDVSRSEFLTPFFQIGLLYQADGIILFTHPYLESYLLAQALREQPPAARAYFDPKRDVFNYYAYDLYCEMGPDADVVSSVSKFALDSLVHANTVYGGKHIYIDTTQRLTLLSTPRQLAALTKGIVKTAQKLEREDTSDDVRAEKQRILDAKRYVRSEVGSRNPSRDQALPEEVKVEFDILDDLSRALALCTTGIGSGSEALSGDVKTALAELILQLGSKFSDVWTRNRLRINFDETRRELLADDRIWKYIHDAGIEESQFGAVKAELDLSLYGAELNAIVDPMGRVLWRISAAAGVKVLAPILQELQVEDPIQRILRACWFMDVDPTKGKDDLKDALADYKGNALLRFTLAGHLLWRVFWHHYKTSNSEYFVASARRALAPIGLAPTSNRVNQVKKGPHE